MKKIITIFIALLFNAIVGATLGGFVGIDPAVAAIGANCISVLAGAFLPAGVLNDGVLTEVWTGELVKKLKSGLDGSWLDGIPDYSSIVDNDVIHLVDVGADPTVLIDNTSYPLSIEQLPDGDIAIKLSKFETLPTSVTDDELYAVSYDKMARVKEAHGDSININKFKKAAHAICPAGTGDSAALVIATSGNADASNGRKAFAKADILAAKKALDKLGVPASDRRLVLCSDHVNDMLGWSEAFERQYNLDNVNGKVARLYGFDIYEYSENPLYTTAGVKKSLGATADTGEFQCSFAFYAKRVFKATGSTQMYYSEAKTDPQNHRNLIDFLHRFVCIPKKADAAIAIMSGFDGTAVTTPSLSVSTQTVTEFTKNGGTKHITVTAVGGGDDWSVAVDDSADWFTVEAAGNQVCIVCAANDSTAREGSFTVTYGDLTKTVAVSQAAAGEAASQNVGGGA